MSIPVPASAAPGRPDATRGDRRGLILDLAAVLAGAGLVTAAALLGWALIHQGASLFLGFPPILATWDPHVGPGSVIAVLTALLVAGWGPGLAERLSWPVLLPAAWAASVVWTLSLALIDGYQTGIAGRLTSTDEYLHDVARVPDIVGMLHSFSSHILTDRPGFWTTHVGAHPPGVFLLFVWLERIGLGGGGPAGIFCILVGGSAGRRVGGSACVAVAVTLRALGAEQAARVALPFGVLFPGAVWVGVSADGMFASVLASGVALLAIGATTGRPPIGPSTMGRYGGDVAALAGGLLLGYTLYLSYGLALGGLSAFAVVALTRRLRPVLFALLGAMTVAAAFTAAGFWWPTGYELTTIIYRESAAKTRPYSYFVWADLAAVLLALGPAIPAGLRRLAAHPCAVPLSAGLLTGAALAAILIADISGLSKAEVERIWLPFGVWLMIASAALPRSQRSAWLLGQALLALLVNHLLLTAW